MRILPYLLYLLLISFWVVILRDGTALFGATINLPAFLVLAVALYKDDLAAVWFGFFVGVIGAAATPQLMGWLALVTAGLGLVASFVKVRLNLDSLKAKILLIAGGVLVHNILTLAIIQPENFWSLLVVSGLGGTVYTTVLAWLFFLVKEGLITYQKVKSIF